MIKVQQRPTCRLVAFVAVIAMAVLVGCANESRRLDVRVIDEAGDPVADALFYAEAFTYSERAFDFAWGRSGEDGYVFGNDDTPLEIGWKSDAKLSHAAFAPGMKPAGLIDHIGSVSDSAFEVILYDTVHTDLDYQPVLTKMSFPFESNPALAHRLRKPSNRPLLMAFRDGFEPLAAGGLPTTPDERAKLSFLDSLLRDLGRRH